MELNFSYFQRSGFASKLTTLDTKEKLSEWRKNMAAIRQRDEMQGSKKPRGQFSRNA